MIFIYICIYIYVFTHTHSTDYFNTLRPIRNHYCFADHTMRNPLFSLLGQKPEAYFTCRNLDLVITLNTLQRKQWHPTPYSRLGNPTDGGAWWATVHGVTESQTWLSDFTFTFHFHALEKEMATHSSVLALRIPGTGEPGGLPSMGLHRVGRD